MNSRLQAGALDWMHAVCRRRHDETACKYLRVQNHRLTNVSQINDNKDVWRCESSTGSTVC